MRLFEALKILLIILLPSSPLPTVLDSVKSRYGFTQIYSMATLKHAMVPLKQWHRSTLDSIRTPFKDLNTVRDYLK